ncbi:MAG: cytochrome c peroxidase [Bacteroidota bacterium]
MKKRYPLGPWCLLLLSLLQILSCQKLDPFETPQYPVPADRQIIEKHLNLPEEPYEYLSGFNTQLLGEEILMEGEETLIELGRVLFYETALSADGNISCASCHIQELAFADRSAFSQGVNGHFTDRNSFALGALPSLSTDYTDLAVHFYALDSFVLIPDIGTPVGVFWDERAEDFFVQMTETFENEKEMGIPVASIPERLSGLEYYPILFERAFRDDSITTPQAMTAILTFMNSIANTKSPYDLAAQEAISRNDSVSFFGDFASFTPEQNRGKQLFLANCAACHGSSIDIRLRGEGVKSTACNGLDQEYTDQGVGAFLENQALNGVFKIPSMRNISVSAPYMHDGRFRSLEEVLRHYSEGIQAHPNLDPLLKDEFGNPKRMNFSQEEMDALLAFFDTLKDEHLLTHEKWSNPFK